MTAAELKERLYGRHAATVELSPGHRIVGAWTCVEEFRGIDFLALSAHASPSHGGLGGIRYPRVGYEVKVSRSDLRRELLNPRKRARNVEWCNAFYFAVPAGLLTDAELAFDEPADWTPPDFSRLPCPKAWGQPDAPAYTDPVSPCQKGKRQQPFIGPPGSYGPDHVREVYRYSVDVECETCGGKGYWRKSRVELEAPTLWVPRDVGLIVVDGGGCKVVRKAPTRKIVPSLSPSETTEFARWVSARPDPRHAEIGRTPLAGVQL